MRCLQGSSGVGESQRRAEHGRHEQNADPALAARRSSQPYSFCAKRSRAVWASASSLGASTQGARATLSDSKAHRSPRLPLDGQEDDSATADPRLNRPRRALALALEPRAGARPAGCDAGVRGALGRRPRSLRGARVRRSSRTREGQCRRLLGRGWPRPGAIAAAHHAAAQRLRPSPELRSPSSLRDPRSHAGSASHHAGRSPGARICAKGVAWR
jgi:hypothetical protein